MKKERPFLMIITAPLLCTTCAIMMLTSCGRPASRTVDVSRAAPADMETVASSWELLPVDESEIPLPQITEVKRYGAKTFISAGRYPNASKVYVLDGTRPARVLDAYGRGPGEYQDAESFAFCEETSELIINDRKFKGFRRYRVPDMTWVSDEHTGVYLQHFESLDATHSVFFIEPHEPDPGKMVIWDHTRSEAAYSMEVSEMAAFLGAELRMTRAGKGVVYFGVPGKDTEIWKATKSGFSRVGAIGLVPDAFAAIWDEKDSEMLSEELESILGSGNTLGIGADAPLVDAGKMAFWYFTGFDNEPAWQLAISTSGSSQAISALTVEGYPEPLQVIGTGDSEWCSVLLPELLEDIPSPKGKLYPQLRELASQGFETVLLFWSAGPSPVKPHP